MKWLTAIIMTGCALIAHAGPADFARGRVIVVGEDLLQRARLPQDVYEWVVRDDLGDLRVFNREAEQVPYALRRPATTSSHSDWQDLPVFTLPIATPTSTAGTEVKIELGKDGAVVAVHGGDFEHSERANYLIDLSQYDHRVADLELSWTETADNFISHFRVLASDDLNEWRTVTSSATLAALETGGKQIFVNRIELNDVSAEYLKLQQLDGADTIAITSVTARTKLAELPRRNYKVLAASAADGGYEFDTGGRFALDRVTVEIARPSYLVEARLYSRANTQDKWRDRGRRTFYQVTINGSSVASDPVRYASPYHRFWRVKLLGDEVATPSLRIGWLPDELVFLKQGSPPFTLAYGQADISGRPWPIEDLLTRLGTAQEFDLLPFSTLREPEVLGGAERLIAKPAAIDWQTITLWLILLIGVGVIGALAYRVVRQQ